jgi:hypothetical protein
MRLYATPDMQPCGQYVPDYFLSDNDNERDEALERYFDAPVDSGTPDTVTRYANDPRPFTRTCSTYNPQVPVTMPRVSFIDGSYGEADNDNRRAA